ncbi:uncharacterized protein LOC126846697 isoform X2 [Adelges cooleyi]|nr:uncharacterized protein LOC126846697 isoform X2 [Adelges cooleyi]
MKAGDNDNQPNVQESNIKESPPQQALLGTMKAGDNDNQPNVQESNIKESPPQQVNANEVQYREVVEAVGTNPQALGDWIFNGVVPERSSVPYVPPEQNEFGYDYDTSLPYTENHMS